MGSPGPLPQPPFLEKLELGYHLDHLLLHQKLGYLVHPLCH